MIELTARWTARAGAMLGAWILATGTWGGVADAASVTVRVPLAATGADPDAFGDAKVNVRDRASGLSGKLEVRGRRLTGAAAYQVTVDGVAIGGFTTARSGTGKAKFATAPGRRDQLLGVDPRGRTVAVVAPAGAIVLQAAMPATGRGGAGDVRCCLPDGGGDGAPECEDRTAAECSAEGGVDLGPGSCLPNPCESSTPGAGRDVRCCLPDDSGPECEDRTAAQCSAHGGVNLGAGACTPNPCGGSVTTSTLPGATTTTLPGGGGARIEVRCERRADRSKISVDGNGLVPGTYAARVSSGPGVAMAGPKASTGDEVEFDVDSDPGDVAAGATAIAAGFIEGAPPRVTGELLDAAGGVVASATRSCVAR